MGFRTIRAAAGALALALFATSAANAQAPATTPAPLKLDIPYNAIAINVAPLWIAIDNGLFRRYGIEATTELSSKSPVLVASILSGETPFAIAGQDAVISADLNGGDIALLVTSTEKLFFTLVAQPGIHTVADLKDKKIGVTAFGTTTDFVGHYVATQAGLRAQDVTFLPIGSDANIFAALTAGAIDAGVQGSDVVLKPKQYAGYNLVAAMTDYDLLFYTGALVASRSWVAAHHDTAMNVVRGYVAGIATFYSDKKAALAAIGKYTHTNDPAALEGAYQLLARMLLKLPVPQPAGVRSGLAESPLRASKTADPAQFIDTSFVDALQKDGFVAGLYK